jgi:hypothetical protein
VEQNTSARIDEIPEAMGHDPESVKRFSVEIRPKQFESGVTVVGFGRRLNWKARAMIAKKEGRPEAAFATLWAKDRS